MWRLDPALMNYEFCTRTDPGLARENNEDSIAIDEPTRLGVLADGMGGYNAGEIASGMATTFIKSELGRWLSQAGRHANAREVRRAMEICVDNANRSIFNAANSNPQYSGMGTTLVLGVFQDDRLMLGHIGDSRCYRLRAGDLAQITKDHSLLQEQLDAGLITLRAGGHLEQQEPGDAGAGCRGRSVAGSQRTQGRTGRYLHDVLRRPVGHGG